MKQKAKKVAKEEVVLEEEAVVEPQEDRSAFNCPDCKGEGLESPTKLCAKCNGTGKV